MIASLRGTVLQLQVGAAVVEVNGIGYLVTISPALGASFSIGDEIFLHTSQIIREDAHLLFGFAQLAELEMFEMLRSVTGVGPKSALGIVSAVGIEEIKNAVVNENDGVFRAVSGVGPKTAKLITVTLAGKFIGGGKSVDSDLVAALVGLGYKEAVASAALRDATGNDPQSRLRSALAILSGVAK